MLQREALDAAKQLRGGKGKIMLAYHNDQAVKDFYLARIRTHAAADELIHGTYWEDGKGCAVGCTVHSDSHAAYETELGIPRILARLEDGIFESLSNGRSKLWPEQFLDAIKPGADLSFVWPRFAVWLLTDKWHGVLQYAKTQKAKIAIQNVSDAYQSTMVEGQKKEIDWSKLRAAADAAARIKHREAQADKLLELLRAA